MSNRLRERLITELLRRDHLVKGSAIEAAVRATRREVFIPNDVGISIEAIYSDEAIVTKRDGTGVPISSSSQPSLMVAMLNALQVLPGDRVLEVGTGTGYNAALLRHLVGRRGEVVSVEIDPVVADRARLALAEHRRHARVITGDGYDIAESGGYDAIIVTAASTYLPAAWHALLRPGGRLVVPVRLNPDGTDQQVIVVFERDLHGFRSVEVIPGGFMSMRTDGGNMASRPPRPVGIQVLDHTGETARHLFVSGPGLDGLGPTAREALVSTLMAGSRTRSPLRSMTTNGLPLYLRLSLTDFVEVFSTFTTKEAEGTGNGVGIAERDGSGATVVAGHPPDHTVDIGTTPTCHARLNAMLGPWEEATAQNRCPLDIRVTYPCPQQPTGSLLTRDLEDGSRLTIRLSRD